MYAAGFNVLLSHQTSTFPGLEAFFPVPLSLVTPVVPSGQEPATLDAALFLRKPNTSAADWANTRVLWLTEDMRWPNASGLAATAATFGNGTADQSSTNNTSTTVGCRVPSTLHVHAHHALHFHAVVSPFGRLAA